MLGTRDFKFKLAMDYPILSNLILSYLSKLKTFLMMKVLVATVCNKELNILLNYKKDLWLKR